MKVMRLLVTLGSGSQDKPLLGHDDSHSTSVDGVAIVHGESSRSDKTLNLE